MTSEESNKSIERWDYRVVGINIGASNPSDSKQASEKLENKLSAQFLEKEFPDEYQKKQSTNLALQCQQIIQIYGKHRWEHYQQGQLANTAMLYFKRKVSDEYPETDINIKQETILTSALDPLQRP
jgi:hypothetical protein